MINSMVKRSTSIILMCQLHDTHFESKPVSLSTCIIVKMSSLSGGKRDEKLILPTNSSLSVTLDQNEVSDCVVKDETLNLTQSWTSPVVLVTIRRCPQSILYNMYIILYCPYEVLLSYLISQLSATTSIALSKAFHRDRIWINGRYYS